MLTSLLAPTLSGFVPPAQLKLALVISTIGLLMLLAVTIRLHRQEHPLAVWLWVIIIFGVVSVTLRTPFFI